MSFIDRQLKQTIVYWASPVQGGSGGFSFDSPVEITGRWEDVQEKFIDERGEEKVSKSSVFLEQDVDLGGYLFLGELNDLDSDQDPETQAGAYRILVYNKIPSIKADVFLRKAIL